MIKAILAVDENGAIGYRQHLPWPHISSDLQNFQKLTKYHTVVMGSKTWYSLPKRSRPLPLRKNWVVTSTPIDGVNCMSPKNVKIDLYTLDSKHNSHVWVIGGATLINHVIDIIEEFHITRIHNTYPADIYIDTDKLLEKFTKINENHQETYDGLKISFETWQRIPIE